MSKNEKTYHLNKDAAYQLIKMAVDSYKASNNCYPKELFIHGKTSFTDEEWEGFELATKDATGINLVGITIKSTDGFRIFNDTYGKAGKYGVFAWFRLSRR